MLMEFMIFMAFYAVAFMAHSVHAVKVKKAAPDATSTHRFALVFAAVVKAGGPALHEYAVHFIVYSGYVIHGH